MSGAENIPQKSESLSTYDKAVEVLVAKGHALVDLEFGPDSHAPKPYHGPEHTAVVIESSALLADAAIANGKISHRQKQLLLIAAAYHDTVQNSVSSDNEELSAEIAVRHMRMLGIFGATEVHSVVDAILATKTNGVFADHIEQSVDGKAYIARLLADADLSILGLPVDVYWPAAQRFFAETHPGQELASENLKKFLQEQVLLVDGHQFHTEEARQLFNHQPEIVGFLQSQLAT